MATGAAQDDPAERPHAELQERIEARIRRLERTAGNGLWAMVGFLLASMAAFDGFARFPELSPTFRQTLGTPPPAEMISLALVIYAFSGIVLTLARMTSGTVAYRGFVHAAFFSAFYLFYHLSGALADNFWATFLAGISVMGLESYHLWTRSNRSVRKEQALLERIRAGKPLIIEEDEE